jgi:hypothetical protein
MAFKRYADTIRTCMMAGVSMGLLFTAVSAYAVTAHQPAPPPPRPMFNDYLRQDDALGALRRDLMTKQSQGANASTLLAWMQQGGFQCEANLREPGAYDCTYRRHLLFDRVAELQARIITNGTLLSTVTAPVPVFALDRTNNTALLTLAQSGS